MTSPADPATSVISSTPFVGPLNAGRVLDRALARWQHAAGPYWPYVGATPFFGNVPAAWLSGAADRGGRALAAAILALAPDEPTALFVDGPVTRSLLATAELNRGGFFVVPVVQRWVTTPAVLGCRLLVARLVAASAGCRPPRSPRGVVFLLDGERGGGLDERADAAVPRRAFDNRYTYPACRFPPPSFLLAQGVTAVRWLSAGGVADDLREYADWLATELAPEPGPTADGSGRARTDH